MIFQTTPQTKGKNTLLERNTKHNKTSSERRRGRKSSTIQKPHSLLHLHALLHSATLLFLFLREKKIFLLFPRNQQKTLVLSVDASATVSAQCSYYNVKRSKQREREKKEFFFHEEEGKKAHRGRVHRQRQTHCSEAPGRRRTPKHTRRGEFRGERKKEENERERRWEERGEAERTIEVVPC